MSETVINYVLLTLFSLSIGSLLNVIIYRLPIMLHSQWRYDCQSLLSQDITPVSTINLFLPRSFCPTCRNPIRARHNIPLLSYLLLRGCCRNCDQKIPVLYPAVELLTCLLSLCIVWHFGFTLTAGFALLFLWISICLFFIDIQHQLLPDSLTLGLLWLGLLANTQQLFTTLPDAVLSAIGGYLFLWFFIRIFYLLTGKIGMGNGDFKLFAALGAWFGWIKLPFILFSASFGGVIFGLIYLNYTNKSKDTPFAFGPFLCLAGVITLFFGETFIKYYLSLWV